MSRWIRGCRQSPCKNWCVLSIAFLLVASAATGEVRINSSPNVVGSGARALGMGGAFIAIADDATAASWNPGGLTQLERPELSLVYSGKWFSESMGKTSYLGPDTDPEELDLHDINYLSIAYPLPWTVYGRNLVLSLNYQRKYDMDRTLRFHVWKPFGVSSALFGGSNIDVDYKQEGGLGTLSPAFGFEVTERLSLGIVANIWNSSIVPDNEWRSETREGSRLHYAARRIGGGTWGSRTVGTETIEKYENLEGINYTLGALYRVTERLTLGAVYNTAYSTDLDYTRLQHRFALGAAPDLYRSHIRIDWPAVMGVGVAYRFPNDKLTLSLDVTTRNWENYIKTDRRAGPLGRRVSAITNMPDWLNSYDPTYTVRLGAEYVFVNPKRARQDFLPSLRAGLFYDPEPASGRKDAWWGVKRGDGKPDDYYGVALGLGVLIKNRVNIDLAYQYRWGNDVRRDTLVDQGNTRTPVGGGLDRGFKEDVDQHLLYLSTVIYF